MLKILSLTNHNQFINLIRCFTKTFIIYNSINLEQDIKKNKKKNSVILNLNIVWFDNFSARFRLQNTSAFIDISYFKLLNERRRSWIIFTLQQTLKHPPEIYDFFYLILLCVELYIFWILWYKLDAFKSYKKLNRGRCYFIKICIDKRSVQYLPNLKIHNV